VTTHLDVTHRATTTHDATHRATTTHVATPHFTARRLRGRTDAGMATAELAVALPVLMLLVLTAVYAVQVAGTRVRCLDAAREVARAAARSDPAALGLARAVLPGSSVHVRRSSAAVTATVTIRLRPLGSGLPAVTVSEQITARTEPDATGVP
jgi:Flp pilus assembly protein TadG